MDNTDPIILLVSEEDASDTYYRVLPAYSNILVRIHDKRFIFGYPNVKCDDNSVYMDDKIISFLNKLRHGRYTSDWKDIAERIIVFELMDPDARCLPHNYHVFFGH